MVLVMPGKWAEGEAFDEGRLAERILLAAHAHGVGGSIGWFRDAGKNLTFAGEPYHVDGVMVTLPLIRPGVMAGANLTVTFEEVSPVVTKSGGVTSVPYGPWGGSFRVEAGRPPRAGAPGDARPGKD